MKRNQLGVEIAVLDHCPVSFPPRFQTLNVRKITEERLEGVCVSVVEGPVSQR